MTTAKIDMLFEAKKREEELVAISDSTSLDEVSKKLMQIANYGRSEQHRIARILAANLEKSSQFSYIGTHLKAFLEETPKDEKPRLGGDRGFVRRLHHLSRIHDLGDGFDEEHIFKISNEFIKRIKKDLAEGKTSDAAKKVASLEKVLINLDHIIKTRLEALEEELKSIKGSQEIDKTLKEEIRALQEQGERLRERLQVVEKERKSLAAESAAISMEVVEVRKDEPVTVAPAKEAPKDDLPKMVTAEPTPPPDKLEDVRRYRQQVNESLDRLQTGLTQLQTDMNKYKNSWSYIWRKVLSIVTVGLYEFDTGPNSLSNKEQRAEESQRIITGLRGQVEQLDGSPYVVDSKTRQFGTTKEECQKFLKQVSQDDYYAVLGLEKTASSGDIRKAYIHLLARFHPDRNPGHTSDANEVVKIIGKANDVLSSPEHRRAYDSTYKPYTEVVKSKLSEMERKQQADTEELHRHPGYS